MSDNKVIELPKKQPKREYRLSNYERKIIEEELIYRFPVVPSASLFWFGNQPALVEQDEYMHMEFEWVNFRVPAPVTVHLSGEITCKKGIADALRDLADGVEKGGPRMDELLEEVAGYHNALTTPAVDDSDLPF